MRIFGHVITLYRNRKSLVFAGVSRYLQSFLLCRRPEKNKVCEPAILLYFRIRSCYLHVTYQHEATPTSAKERRPCWNETEYGK